MFNFMNTTPSVTPNEASTKVTEPNTGFIDVRSLAEYQGGHAVGAQNIPLETLEAHTSSLKEFDAVFVICQSGGRSSNAVNFLLTQDVNAFNVTGGTSAWQIAGLPIE